MDITNKDSLTHEELVRLIAELEARYYAFESVATAILSDFVLSQPEPHEYLNEVVSRSRTISYSRDTATARMDRERAAEMIKLSLLNAAFVRR